jgi:hypothetical protein
MVPWRANALHQRHLGSSTPLLAGIANAGVPFKLPSIPQATYEFRPPGNMATATKSATCLVADLKVSSYIEGNPASIDMQVVEGLKRCE